MEFSQELLLIGAIAAIGVLHTLVPDHWLPITLIARQRGWTRAETLSAALKAGSGHVLTTLVIASLVWVGGFALASRMGQLLDLLSSLALIAFGGWIAVSAWLALRRSRRSGLAHSHGHSHSHDHVHDHEGTHEHSHGHPGEEGSEVGGEAQGAGPRPGRTKGRAALIFILGSSPMVESIPVFFKAGKFSPLLILLMSLVLAAATITTYAVLSVYPLKGLKRLQLGFIENYGEVLSGALVALLGLAFWLWPIL
jgi:ABC-type nickel/cobalt efflux system permease component RcnA